MCNCLVFPQAKQKLFWKNLNFTFQVLKLSNFPGSKEDWSSGGVSKDTLVSLGPLRTPGHIWVGWGSSNSKAGLRGRQLLPDAVLIHLPPAPAATSSRTPLGLKKKRDIFATFFLFYINFDLEKGKKMKREKTVLNLFVPKSDICCFHSRQNGIKSFSWINNTPESPRDFVLNER